MDKQYYSPLQLLTIATQHAYSAEYILHHIDFDFNYLKTRDPLLPVASLMYTAFHLTLRAYLMHEQRLIKGHKTLLELLELNRDLVFSAQDLQLLKNLSRQLAYSKGIDHDLWQDRQQQHVFCMEIIKLYERLQEMMPLELQSDYQPAAVVQNEQLL